MIWILAFVCLCLFLYPVLLDLYLIYIKGMPPGPLSLPIIGGVHYLSPKHPHLSLEALGKRYGKIFSLRMGTMGRAVFLQDIDLVNQMFENPNTHDRPALPVFDVVNNGADGIGSCDYGHRWKIMTKVFHRGLARMSANVIEDKATHAYSQLQSMFLNKSSKGTQYNPRKDLITACSAILSSMVYGKEPENFDSPDLKSRIHYHSTLMSMINPSHPMNILPILWKLPSPIKSKLVKCLEERDKLFDQSFSSHTDKYNGEIEDMFDIVTEFEMSKADLEDNTEIRKVDMFLSVWTLYLAGCDTTTDLSLWIILYMCVFPHVQEKMKAELDDVFKDEPENILLHKHKLNYTRATILECLRLSSPTAMGLPSTTNRDFMIGGYIVPKGTAMMPSQWHIHHDEKHWPDPFDLKPERFLDENGNIFSNNHIFKKMPFIPFSRGKRQCLGKAIALDLQLIFVTIIFKRLHIQLPSGYKPDLTGNVLFNLRPYDFPIQCTEQMESTQEI